MTRPRGGRAAAAAGLALLWLAGIAVTGLWFRLALSARGPSGFAAVPGLSAPVEVLVDSLAIPHVLAATELDAAMALGWLHAGDRLWQMELFRRVAEGRLAEVFGERALETDRFVRTLGLSRAAARAADALEPEDAARLAAYARGVNARLAAGPIPPPEFQVLRVRTRPWDARASLAVGMVMNLDLAVWRSDLARLRIGRRFGPDRLARLLDGYPPWGPTILAAPVEVPRGPATDSMPGASTASAMPGAATPHGPTEWDPFDVLASVSARSGSNAWVVAGDRTASGAPILANDMHLALRAPSLWYLAALHGEADDLHVAGFTLPGLPGVVVGHNRSLAWGFTNGMVDDVDFFIETLSPDGRRYLDADGWTALAARPETITVRGRAEPEILDVRSTPRGPLLSDVLPGLEADLSVLWVPARVDAGTAGIAALNRAADAEDFDRAVARFALPHQNVVFADRAGTIGYRLGGRIPLRDGADGGMPSPGAAAGPGWPGFWPPKAHPAVRNPRQGYVATANNLQAPGLGRAIGSDYAAPFRAERITRALEVRRDWTPASTEALQRDTYSLLAARTLGRAVAAARRSGEAEAAELLSGWDRNVTADSRAAPLFYSWFHRLRALIAGDEFEGERWTAFPVTAVLAVLEEGDASPWVDDIRTPGRERLRDLEERAVRDALRVTAGARWDEVHDERHSHPLGDARLLDHLLRLNVGPWPQDGGPHTLRPVDYGLWTGLGASSWTPPWRSEYGPSERFVAHVRPEGIDGRFLVPTGQSGNPFSPHYRDMSPRWRTGGLVPVPLSPEAARARATGRLLLEPAPTETEGR